MRALKRIITVAVMAYLLLALLFILAPAARNSVMDMGSGLSVLEKERQFYYVMFVVGAVVLTLHLITENLDSLMLRRTVSQHESKINELKARLYDHQQTTAAPVALPSGRPVAGRLPDAPMPASRPTENRPSAPLPQPTFPQADPSLSNTPPADRPPLA